MPTTDTINPNISFIHVDYPVRKKGDRDAKFFYSAEAEAQKRMNELLSSGWYIADSNVVEGEYSTSIVYALVKEA